MGQDSPPANEETGPEWWGNRVLQADITQHCPVGVWFGWGISQPCCRHSTTQLNMSGSHGRAVQPPPSSPPTGDKSHSAGCLHSPLPLSSPTEPIRCQALWLPGERAWPPTPTPQHGNELTSFFHHGIFRWPVCSPMYSSLRISIRTALYTHIPYILRMLFLFYRLQTEAQKG